MASIIEFSSERTPVVAQTPVYNVPTISGSYTAAEVQAMATQIGVLTVKLREAITDLQSISVIKES